METKEMFQEELMSLEVEVENETELFAIINQELSRQGYVTANYLAGITKREEQFPTGLITQFLNIALPHGDAVNVLKPFVYVARLAKPITVKQMGDSQEMLVKDFFFLGISDGSKQVGLLATLMELFMQESFVKGYIASQTTREIQAVIQKYIEIGVS